MSGMGKISITAVLLLAGLLLTGCDKLTSLINKKSTARNASAAKSGGNSETNILTRDLGAISLTNHCETCVPLSTNKDCLLEPSLFDSRDIQLTVTVQTKNAQGQVRDMSMTEVTARLGKPLDVSVGEFTFTLTPNMAADKE